MPELCYSVTEPLRIYYEKRVSYLKQRLNRIYPRCVISFVPLITHFGIFVRTYNWNHYRRIRVNVISLRLESIFFWPKTPKFGDLGLKVLKTNVWFESAPSKQDTGKLSLKLKS